MSPASDGGGAYRHVDYLLNSQPGALSGMPLAFAHRGADPQRENTMAAFQHAVDLGFRYLEVDVQTTADGELVIFHDDTLDRMTDGSGTVNEKTWDELAQLRVVPAGEPLLRFAEALLAFPDTYFNVDLKDDGSVEPFARIVDAHRAHHRVLAASFADARRRRVQQLLAQPVAASPGKALTARLVLFARLGLSRAFSKWAADIDCVQVPFWHGRIRVVTEGFIGRCHQAGLQVHVWVVDEPEQMRQLLDLGVDGIMTDDPEALASVMSQRSVWPQTTVSQR